MKKMKVVFENPETRHRDSIVLDDHEDLSKQPGLRMTQYDAFREVFDKAKSNGMVRLPGFGEVVKQSIRGFFDVYPDKEDQNEYQKTRMETDPPSNIEWKAICKAVESKMAVGVWTPLIFRAVCMSIWNLNSERTRSTIEAGKKILQKEDPELVF